MATHDVTVVLKAKDQASAAVRSLRTQFKSFSGDMAKGFGIGAGMNVFSLATQGIGKFVDFAGDAIGMASDLAEAQSKVTVVFGEQADEIGSWARSAAQSMGLAEGAATDAVGTLGNLLKGAGLTGEALADMSTDVVQLAADLGSFNNVETPEVLEAIKSGLNGEAEPMRKFGVLLNEAKVKARGMQLGLADANGELSDGAKVQARYAEIMAQTGDAQGDFARTADGMANSQRIANANLANMQTNLGKILKTVADPFLGFLSDLAADLADPRHGVTAATRQFVDELYAVPPAIEAVTGTQDDLAARIQITRDEISRMNEAQRTSNQAWVDFHNALVPAARALKINNQDLNDLARHGFDAGRSVEQVKIELLGVSQNARSSAGWTQELVDGFKGMGRSSISASQGLEGFDEALTEIATEALPQTKEQLKDTRLETRRLERAWRDLIRGPDTNRKALRELNREIPIWERRQERALREGNSAAYAYATSRIN